MPLKDESKRREYRKEYRGRPDVKAHRRALLSTPIYVEKNRQNASRSRREKPDSSRNSQYKISYGITLAQYNERLENQNGVCAICSKPETADKFGKPRRLSVDHCHKSGAVRGLLCMNCNHMIGKAKDSTAILMRAISYLSEER